MIIMRNKKCPRCGVNLMKEVLVKSLAISAKEFRKEKECPSCNLPLEFVYPSFYDANYSVPLGFSIAVLIGYPILYYTGGRIFDKLAKILPALLLAILIFWLLGSVLTKIEKG